MISTIWNDTFWRDNKYYGLNQRYLLHTCQKSWNEWKKKEQNSLQEIIKSASRLYCCSQSDEGRSHKSFEHKEQRHNIPIGMLHVNWKRIQWCVRVYSCTHLHGVCECKIRKPVWCLLSLPHLCEMCVPVWAKTKTNGNTRAFSLEHK